jgi:ankyrin repeat protein
METKEKTKPSIYEIITMTPNIAYDRVIEEINDESPDFELIKDIFENSLIGVNYVDKPERISNKSALHHAAWNGKDKVVEFLLEIGADPNIKSRSTFGYTPLHCSAEQGHSKVTELLLKAGADPEIKDDDPDTNEGQTALHLAVEASQRPETVAVLLKYGANPNSRTNYGYTPLFDAFIFNETNEIFDMLIKAGADPNIVDDVGNSALHLLPEHDSATVHNLMCFLESGADITLKNDRGETALSIALNKISDLERNVHILDIDRKKKEELENYVRILKLFQNYKNKQTDPA